MQRRALRTLSTHRRSEPLSSSGNAKPPHRSIVERDISCWAHNDAKSGGVLTLVSDGEETVKFPPAEIGYRLAFPRGFFFFPSPPPKHNTSEDPPVGAPFGR